MKAATDPVPLPRSAAATPAVVHPDAGWFSPSPSPHVVSAYKEQPPVFYSPEEQDAQAVQVPFIAAVQMPTAQY